MTTTSAAVLADISILLPESNVLTEAQMLNIIDRIILSVGDEDEKYGEVCCKSLKVIGEVNLAKVAVDRGSLKREKVGDHEEEYLSAPNSNGSWQDFIDSLSDLCPIMWGYSPKTTTGIYISTTPLTNPLCPLSYSDGY